MAGKNMNDRELAARVRTLALEEIEKVLIKGNGQLYEAVLIKLAGSVLPRLNELTGDGGGPIEINGNAITFANYGESYPSSE